MSKEENIKEEIIELTDPVIDDDIIELTDTAVDDSVILELRAPVVDDSIIDLTEQIDIEEEDIAKAKGVSGITDFDFDKSEAKTDKEFEKVDISDDVSDFELSGEFDSVNSFGDSDMSGDFATDDIDSIFDSKPEVIEKPVSGFSVSKLSGLPDLTKGRGEEKVEVSGNFSPDEIDSMFGSNDLADKEPVQDLTGEFSVDDIDSLFDDKPEEVERKGEFDIPKLSGLPDLTKGKGEEKIEVSGNFSPDEIDSMFDSNDMKGTEPEPVQDLTGEFSVDDIDSLFDDKPEEVERKGEFDIPKLSGLPDLTKGKGEEKVEVSGNFSPDEIDSMFDSNDMEEAESEQVQELSEDFSVDDIDALFDEKAEVEEEKPEVPDDDEFSPGDIEALIEQMNSEENTASDFKINKLSGLPDLTKGKEGAKDRDEENTEVSGSFSPDEIDSMFDSNDMEETEPEQAQELSEDFSVDDIDALFDEKAEVEEEKPEVPDDDEFSPGDIEALIEQMNSEEDTASEFKINKLSGLPDLTKGKEGAKGKDEENTEVSGSFSPDEIDSMFDSNDMEETEPEQAQELSEDFSVDDIDALFDSKPGEDTKEVIDIPKLSGLPDLTKGKEEKTEDKGSFSSDEIDSMFDSDDLKAAEPEPVQELSEDFSVDDIDALFDEKAETEEVKPEDEEFSPGDIENLIEQIDSEDNEVTDFDLGKLSGLPDLAQPREEIVDKDILSDGFSNDDIDSLFDGEGEEKVDSEIDNKFEIPKLSGLPDLTKSVREPESSGEDQFSTDDIDALLEGKMDMDEPSGFEIKKLSGLPDLTKTVNEKLSPEETINDEEFSTDDIDAILDKEMAELDSDKTVDFTGDIDEILNGEKADSFDIKPLSGLPDLTKETKDESILTMDEVDEMLVDVQEGKYEDEVMDLPDADISFPPMDSDDLDDLMLDKLEIETDNEDNKSDISDLDLNVTDKVFEEVNREISQNGEGLSVSKEQIEKAVQSVVKGMYTKKIEMMLLDAIEETVKKEIESIKNKVKD